MKLKSPIYCLMVQGQGLSDETRTMLYREAVQMFRRRKDKLKIKAPDCEGTITTNFSYGAVGSVWGTVFTADVDSESGRTFIRFIVRDWDLDVPIDLDHGEWVPTKDLEIPEDHPASKAMYN